MRLLLIEDDRLMAQTLSDTLRTYYSVDTAATAAEGENLAHMSEYDVILLDYNLPDMDGAELCKVMRSQEVVSPVLMLTGRGATEDKVHALDAGADDYLTKPFSNQELLARIRALLRRPKKNLHPSIIEVGDLSLNLSNQTVIRDGKHIQLRRKELQLLEYLMRNKGRTVTRDMILEHVWDNKSEPITNTVDVHVKYLRDRIDKGFSKKLIKTIYGLGYRIDE